MAEPERLFPREERSQPEPIGESVAKLLSDLEDLIRSEIRLARTEIIGNLWAPGQTALIIAAGSVLAVLGVAFLLIAIMFGLATVMPNWVAALIVGAVALIVGGGLARTGQQRLASLNPAPERAIQSLQEDAEWLRNRMR